MYRLLLEATSLSNPWPSRCKDLGGQCGLLHDIHVGRSLTLGRGALMRFARNTAWISNRTNKFESYKARNVLWKWKSTAPLFSRQLMSSLIDISECFFNFLLWLGFEHFFLVPKMRNKILHNKEHKKKKETKHIVCPSDTNGIALLKAFCLAQVRDPAMAPQSHWAG